MKYPWTALSITVIWLVTTYIIVNRAGLHVNSILLTTLVGTIIISVIGFKSPTIGK